MAWFTPLESPEIEDNYPTEETLRTIAEWPMSDPKGLLKFLCEANIYRDAGYCKLSTDGAWLQFSTGGWSGNEDLIGSLPQWARILRVAQISGGHYLFRDYLSQDTIGKHGVLVGALSDGIEWEDP